MSLSNKALLANLKISQWTGRKFDKRATGTVETTHLTQARVGNYTKKLLPGAKQLEEVKRAADTIRRFFYEQSLPWYADGTRMVASQNYLDFTSKFRDLKGKYELAVADFLTAYPTLKSDACEKLGDLFIDAEYPTVGYLKNAFDCEITFLPVPDVADFRVDILESEKATFLKNMQRVEADATNECWKRLFDVVSKAAQRVADPKAILRESLLENISDICALLPKLNVTDDPELETMRQSVEKTIAGISTTDCRDIRGAREDASRALADITSRMGAFMGAAPSVQVSSESQIEEEALNFSSVS